MPCGGRPRAIHIGNWKKLLSPEGAPKFRAIVEGANLFITQEARIELEKAGVIVLKDASTNKGGVTSSSLEVLSALALEDGEFERLMTVKDGRVPEFRTKYVNAIQDAVHRNAGLEFDRIWKENQASGTFRSVLTDVLSLKINRLADAVRESDLFEDEALRRKVVSLHCPNVLLEQIGIANVLRRVPETYLRAAFACSIASRFVYERGLDANEIDFLHFVQELSA